MKNITIVWTADLQKARQYASNGFEPIECSIGGESVMGPLHMDHHNDQSHREGVAIRAYRDHFGARKSDPRFVVTGEADGDATFAIAALCGILPHPSREAEFAGMPIAMMANLRKLDELAELVNRIDTDPIGVRLEEYGNPGATLLLWNQLASRDQDATAFHAGIDRWRSLLGNPPKALLEGALLQEADRVEKARAAEIWFVANDVLGVVESAEWGFDVWYADVAPVILAYNPMTETASIGCRDLATAEKHFGPGGLKNVFPMLQPQGWGGRETIGGSPRGLKLSREQAKKAFNDIAYAFIYGK